MAQKFSASIKIAASTNMGKVSRKIVESNNKMRRSFEAANRSSKQFTDGLGQLGKRLGQLTVAGFGAAIVKGAQFETSLQDLSALTGLIGDELKFAGDEAIRLSKKYGVSATRILEGTKLVGSARSELLKQPSALTAITEQALILSKAARIDLKSAVDAVTTSMNQFELGTEDSGRVINVLAAGAKVGASEISETAQAVSRAGVAMKIANISFEEGNAAIQVLAKNGIKAERAGTALKTAFLKLSSEGIDSINPQIVGLESALDALADANLDAASLTQLFGLESLAAGKILIENRRLLGQWTREMTGSNTATEQAATNMDTLSEKTKRLGAMFTDQFIAVFQKNEGPLSDLIDQMIIDFEKFRPIEKIFTSISDAIELVIRGTQTLAGGLGSYVGDIEARPTVFGKIDEATGFSDFTRWLGDASGFDDFKVGMKGLFDGGGEQNMKINLEVKGGTVTEATSDFGANLSVTNALTIPAY